MSIPYTGTTSNDYVTCTVTLMSILSKSPVFKPFNLALIQLGGIGANKTDNLKHAREMIFQAAGGEIGKPKPNVIVLPVSVLSLFYTGYVHCCLRKSSILPMAMCTFPNMLRESGMCQGNNTISPTAKAKASGCCHRLQRKQALGSLEV